MSKLSKFLGIAIPIEIRGELLKLYPLTVKEMGILDRIKELNDKKETTPTEKEEMAKLARDLLKISYKEENLTDEEIEAMDIALYSELYSAVMENIIKNNEHGKGIDRIRQLKEKVIQQEPK